MIMQPIFYKLNEDKSTSPFISVEAYVEYLRSKDPIKHLEWRMLAKHNIKNACVSTIFTEVAFPDVHDVSTPFLFETLIIGGRHNGYRFRYKKWDDAISGHQKIIMKLSSDPATDELLEE